MRFMTYFLVIALAMSVQACCFSCANEAKIEPVIKIQTDYGQVDVHVEIANTSEERQQGLMWKEHLDKDSGMIFVFEDEQIRSFWMKNTLIPLDLMFISSNGTIVDIKENFQPCTEDPCESYNSKAEARYVLEVNAGFAGEKDIKIGDTTSI